ncbi:MAG: type II toxin-antitoxin system VapC family toxin [Termitinemataceae bacterium]|nr:MAG: type II toxin-antitoxin system VapC family toxin [Termitinemataceae bacterium]
METKINYLLDTCILIDYLRGNESVYDLLVKDEKVNLYMSTVTMMELMIGALNKREVHYIQKAFNKINIVYIDNKISKLAEELIINYTKSHNLQIDDALIAATSICKGIELITYNISDFHYISNILLYKLSS